MAKKYKEQEKSNNWSFLLKCMVGVTAAAVLAAGIIAAVVLNSAASTTTTVAATAVAAKMMLASTFALLPVILPIVVIAIGLACLLPSLFCCGRNAYSAISTNPIGYRHGGGYGGFYSAYPSTHYHGAAASAYPQPNLHGHPTAGTVHGHDAGRTYPTSAGTVHGHDVGNVHRHIGGYAAGRR